MIVSIVLLSLHQNAVLKAELDKVTKLYHAALKRLEHYEKPNKKWVEHHFHEFSSIPDFPWFHFSWNTPAALMELIVRGTFVSFDHRKPKPGFLCFWLSLSFPLLLWLDFLILFDFSISLLLVHVYTSLQILSAKNYISRMVYIPLVPFVEELKERSSSASSTNVKKK